MEVLACAALDAGIEVEHRAGWRLMDLLTVAAIENGLKYWDFPPT